MFDFKRDFPYAAMAVTGTIMAIVLPLIDPIARWWRRGPLAKMTRIRGRQARRKDFR